MVSFVPLFLIPKTLFVYDIAQQIADANEYLLTRLLACKLFETNTKTLFWFTKNSW